jgi:hypothetical protein
MSDDRRSIMKIGYQVQIEGGAWSPHIAYPPVVETEREALSLVAKIKRETGRSSGLRIVRLESVDV